MPIGRARWASSSSPALGRTGYRATMRSGTGFGRIILSDDSPSALTCFHGYRAIGRGRLLLSTLGLDRCRAAGFQDLAGGRSSSPVSLDGYRGAGHCSARMTFSSSSAVCFARCCTLGRVVGALPMCGTGLLRLWAAANHRRSPTEFAAVATRGSLSIESPLPMNHHPKQLSCGKILPLDATAVSAYFAGGANYFIVFGRRSRL